VRHRLRRDLAPRCLDRRGRRGDDRALGRLRRIGQLDGVSRAHDLVRFRGLARDHQEQSQAGQQQRRRDHDLLHHEPSSEHGPCDARDGCEPRRRREHLTANCFKPSRRFRHQRERARDPDRQRLAQQLARAVQLNAHSARAAVERVRDLGRFQAVQRAQDHRAAVRLLELVDRLRELARALVRDRARERRFDVDQCVRIARTPIAAHLEQVLRAVIENAGQPGLELPPRVPALGRFDGGDERRLHQVLGRRDVADEVDREPQEARRQLVEHVGQRARVARAPPVLETTIGGLLHPVAPAVQSRPAIVTGIRHPASWTSLQPHPVWIGRSQETPGSIGWAWAHRSPSPPFGRS